MRRTKATGLRALLAVGLASLGLMSAIPASATTAGPTAARMPAAPSAAHVQAAGPLGTFSGSASSNLVHVSAAAGLPGVGTLLDAKLVPTIAEVNSTTTPRSHANAKNVGVTVAGTGLPIQEADQTAPPDNLTPLDKDLLPVNANPLATVDAVHSTVNARWPGDQACLPPGVPLSSSFARTAALSALTVPGGSPVLAVNNTVFQRDTVALVNQAGQTGRAVQSRTTIQLSGVTLAGRYTLNLSGPLTATATSTGSAATSTVNVSLPVIQIVDNTTGMVVGTLDAAHNSFALPSNPLINLSFGTHTDTASAGAGTYTVGSTGSLLSIRLLSVPGGPTLATAALGEFAVSATAPTGGVNCPPTPNPIDETHKDVSAGQVAPGGTFTYTITVPNRGTDPITNVKVVDTITGPAGTTVISTDPPATSVSGLTVTWDNQPNLAPNETRNYTITVHVPPNAPNGARYSDTATVTGVYQGVPISKTVTLPLPVVTNPPYPGCHLNESNKAADHIQVTPGETFNYYVHVLNDGSGSCSAITVTDQLDARLSFVSCTNSCTHSGQNVTWTVPSLGPGSSLTLAVVVQVAATATGTLANSAIITPQGGTPITVSTTGPTIGTSSILNPPHPANFGPGPGGGAGRRGPLAFTGWTQPLWLVLAILLVAGGGQVLVRKRHT